MYGVAAGDCDEMTARARSALLRAGAPETAQGGARCAVVRAESRRTSHGDRRIVVGCGSGVLLNVLLNPLLNCVQEQVALAPAPPRASGQSPALRLPAPHETANGVG